MQVPSEAQPLNEAAEFQTARGAVVATLGLRLSSRKPIPDLVYDLRQTDGSSDGFYEAVSRFSDQLLAEIDLYAEQAIRGYSHYLQTKLSESPRSIGDYEIELLTLGMALKLYAGAAQATPDWAMRWSLKLFRLRRRSERMKPLADFARQWLTRLYLLPNIGREAAEGSSPDHLPRLIEWLHATGEFEQEVIRLNNWWSFLQTLPPAEAAHWVELSGSLFDWFRREAERELGAYTEGVPRFLAGEYASRGCREDQIFCGKAAVEYHLNMVAAEIMNRGLRAEFERTPRRVVLVPGCMRGPYETFCQARVAGSDIECAMCSPGCNVNRISRRMRNLGAKIFLVPHAAGFSRYLERWQREPDTAVAAVACMLNILPGGYEMRARGIASQCIPLDFPGCQKHWRNEGIATGMNEDRLVQIVLSTASVN
jgi:hypothetical protein